MFIRLHLRPSATMSTHAAIAASLTKIYDFFVKIGYLDEENVIRPPHTNHPLLADYCREQGIDVNGIEFLKQIPWHTYSAYVYAPLVHKSGLVAWSAECSISDSRRPNPPESICPNPQQLEYLPPHIIALTICDEHGSRAVLLDTSQGKPTSISQDYGLTSIGLIGEWFTETALARVTFEDACTYLNNLLIKYTSLEHIPCLAEIREENDWDHVSQHCYTSCWPNHLTRNSATITYTARQKQPFSNMDGQRTSGERTSSARSQD
jgi:hypothetical protein